MEAMFERMSGGMSDGGGMDDEMMEDAPAEEPAEEEGGMSEIEAALNDDYKFTQDITW